jgi:hypothetical protein
MGKRSRKRGSPADDPETLSRPGSSRTERDAARARRAEAARKRSAAAGSSARPSRRRGRPSIDERPQAPWGKFPLVELVVLVALIMLPLSFVIGGTRGNVMLTAALALGSLAGLELSIREHFGGYRSHTTLLAGFVFVVVVGLLFYAFRQVLAVALPVGAVCFLVTFFLARRAFQRASGGLSYRIGGIRQ